MWIIDNNSSDGTLNFLKTLAPPFYWINKPDTGIYDAMNKGISLAKGQWLYFLGADDRLFDTATLATIFSEQDTKTASLLIGKIKYDFKEKDSLLVKKNNGIFRSSWSNILWVKNSVHHQAVFYKKELIRELKFDVNYSVLSDYYLNLKLFKERSKVNLIEEIIALCGTDGRSKNYNWSLYKEEINLKTALTSQALKPFFFLIAFTKYSLKKLGI